MENAENILFNVASFVAGLFLLERGADQFIDNAAILAKRLNVSPTLVGLLSCGAEWEELVVIAVALGQKQPSLALGNLMGSSIANILASFSLGLLFMKTATFDRSSKIYTAVLLASTSVFLLFLYTLHGTLKRVAGICLLAGFVIYVVSVASLIYRGTLTAPEDDSDDSDSDSSEDDTSDESGDEEAGGYRRPISTSSERGSLAATGKASKRRGAFLPLKARPKPLRHYVVRLVLGLLALICASYIVAHSAAAIGFAMGLSGSVVGTTILSLATTLPEKFVAIMGGVRKQPGIMVANTVGSNIFLGTLCAGVLFVWGDSDQLELGFTAFEALAMWASTALILVIVLSGGKGWMGGVMIGLYITFLVIEFARGRRLDAQD